MNEQDFLYHLENLYELDPDQLVSDLNLTTEQIIKAFPNRVISFLKKEFG